jgi:uncharacterized membrane protein YfcA
MGAVMVAGGIIGAADRRAAVPAAAALGQIDVVINISTCSCSARSARSWMREAVQASRPRCGAAFRAQQAPPPPAGRQPALRWRFYRSGLYISPLAPLLLGVVTGILTMLMGIGGGFVLVPAMLYILGMSANVVVGTSLFQILFVTMATTMMHALTTKAVDIVLAALLLLGSVSGAQFGAHSRRRPSPKSCACAGGDRAAGRAAHGSRPRLAAGRDLHVVAAVRAAWPCWRCCLLTVLLGGARDPILVPEVSQHEIQVRQGFTGAELLLFGAILDPPEGTRAGSDYDIVVVLKGPTSRSSCAKSSGRRHLDQCRQHRFPLRAVLLRGRLVAPDQRDRR